MILAAATHGARVRIMVNAPEVNRSELLMSPSPKTIFSRLIDRLDVYKTYPPQTQDDLRDILAIAKALQEAASQ